LSEFEYLFPGSNRPKQGSDELPAFALTENEQKVYDLIDKESKGIDDVIRESGLSASTVSVTLLGLEMKRIIRQLPGKMFVRNN
jgi:DNA processing protein